MRQIKYIVLHCSATKEGVPFGIEDIDTLACKIRHIQLFAIVKEVGCIQRSAT